MEEPLTEEQRAKFVWDWAECPVYPLTKEWIAKIIEASQACPDYRPPSRMTVEGEEILSAILTPGTEEGGAMLSPWEMFAIAEQKEFTEKVNKTLAKMQEAIGTMRPYLMIDLRSRREWEERIGRKLQELANEISTYCRMVE